MDNLSRLLVQKVDVAKEIKNLKDYENVLDKKKVLIPELCEYDQRYLEIFKDQEKFEKFMKEKQSKQVGKKKIEEMKTAFLYLKKI